MSPFSPLFPPASFPLDLPREGSLPWRYREGGGQGRGRSGARAPAVPAGHRGARGCDRNRGGCAVAAARRRAHRGSRTAAPTSRGGCHRPCRGPACCGATRGQPTPPMIVDSPDRNDWSSPAKQAWTPRPGMPCGHGSPATPTNGVREVGRPNPASSAASSTMSAASLSALPMRSRTANGIATASRGVS